jgi:sporulation protein YlmC with PRC-barrel domain
MIRNLLATTALATLVATGAFAQDANTTAPAPAASDPAATTQEAAPAMKADGHLASNLMGENVYNGTGDDAEHIGDVNDLVIGADGNVEAVVVSVGGFLGLGEKNVAIDFAELDWAERDNDRWLVASMTKEQLEQQTAFDSSAYEAEQTAAMTTSTDVAPAPATDAAQAPAATTEAPADNMAEAPAATTDTTAQAPAATTDTTAQAPAATTDTTAQAPAATTDTTTTAAIDRSTLTEMASGDIRAEEMVGTTVYGANDENVGEIGDVVLTAEGQIDAYIIDVGGFLGIGAKEVAVGSDNLKFMTDANGNKYLYTTFTEEQLEAAPAYEEGTWTQNRDNQRLMVQ